MTPVENDRHPLENLEAILTVLQHARAQNRRVRVRISAGRLELSTVSKMNLLARLSGWLRRSREERLLHDQMLSALEDRQLSRALKQRLFTEITEGGWPFFENSEVALLREQEASFFRRTRSNQYEPDKNPFMKFLELPGSDELLAVPRPCQPINESELEFDPVNEEELEFHPLAPSNPEVTPEKPARPGP